MKVFKTKRSYRKEFKRQLRIAIIAAIGFTVAFSWKNAIYNSSKEFIEKFSQSTQLVLTELLTALFITVLAILVLFITSKILKEK